MYVHPKTQTIAIKAADPLHIRDFHATVLENGSLPLDVLEEQVNAYIAAKKA